MPSGVLLLGIQKTKNAMLNDIFTQIKDQWVRAKHQKKHPFRYVTLTTVASDCTPESRTVVLRDFDASQLTFTIYTDARSRKVKALQKHPVVQLLFYDHKRLWQITVTARLKRMGAAPTIYKQLPPPSRKDYTTTAAPGTPIDHPDHVHYKDENHFYALFFEAEKVESLRLKRPHHLRAVFERNDDWKGQFLTP